MDIDRNTIEGFAERSFIPPASSGRLLQHVRNGIAHRYIPFGSTSRHLEEVEWTFWDRRYSPKKKIFEAPHWCAWINAAELERFMPAPPHLHPPVPLDSLASRSRNQRGHRFA